MFYTYAHTRNDTGQIFYIGKGQRARAYRTSGRSQLWNRIANKHGYKVQILATWQDESSAYEHEKLLIGCFRDLGYELCNFTSGGDGWAGGRHTDESKKQISEYQRSKRLTEEQLQKWRARRHSEETKAKMSAVHRNISEESRERMCVAAKLRWQKLRMLTNKEGAKSDE